ncbi:MAG: HNH endonuclease [Magnetococcales bacterium]|nr:HNH endonuclease [Magnetococcales bacterium]MBF0321574.1 HNH endonuclease [Magnetococcales bacterium]
MDHLLIPADQDHVERERRKAKLLKRSQWWKNVVGQGKCAYCGQRTPPRELTMDHVRPLIRGGFSTRGNCVPACRMCNERKQNLPAEDWKAHQEDG